MSGEIFNKLERLGFTPYEAMVYITLLKKCVSTMRELADESGVPYQKVYEVCSRLENRGFLIVIKSRPRKVKIVNPELSFEKYKSELDGLIDEIKEWAKSEAISKEASKSLHLEGKRTIINFTKKLMNSSRKVMVCFPEIPEWLLKIIREFKGEVLVLTSRGEESKVKGSSAKYSLADNLESKYLIFDESVTLLFSGEDSAVVESCRGCITQSIEHFKAYWRFSLS